MTATLTDFSVPLSAPLETAAGTVDRREGVLLRVDTDRGRCIGEATPLPGWTESLSACRDALAAARPALDAAPPAFDRALDGLDGTPAARHAVALARAEYRALREGVPLYRHLGAEARVDAVPANATVGDADPETTASRARAAAESGFRTVKVKVGARPVDADAERLRAVRAAVGPDVALRADANGAWDREQARAALEALADAEVAYVEQPLPADDLAGHAALRGGDVGVALDESLAERGVDAVLAADAADVLVLKPMALGGPDRARAAARRARAAGVTPVVTTTVDAVVARVGAVHLAASLGPDGPACGLATADRLATDLGPDPAPVAAGAVSVPQGSGLGVGDLAVDDA